MQNQFDIQLLAEVSDIFFYLYVSFLMFASSKYHSFLYFTLDKLFQIPTLIVTKTKFQKVVWFELKTLRLKESALQANRYMCRGIEPIKLKSFIHFLFSVTCFVLHNKWFKIAVAGKKFPSKKSMSYFSDSGVSTFVVWLFFFHYMGFILFCYF